MTEGINVVKDKSYWEARRLKARGLGASVRAARTGDADARLWLRTDDTPGQGPAGDCWTWEGPLDRHGYGRFKVVGRQAYVHRLAYELEHGVIADGRHVLHRCDVRACVNPEHLFLGTNAENVADRNAKGRTARQAGAENCNAKLTEADVIAIRTEYAAGGITHDALAKRFGISRGIVSEIVCSKRWKHVATAPVVPGVILGNALITEVDVLEIRSAYAAGATQRTIAARFGVCRSAVSLIVNRQNWKHVA